jgi:2-desacetyl-2-hydroxyethyl bacteriochlorophyllide A dehydrogenase
MKADAIIFSAEQRVAVQALEVPPPGENEIQVRTLYSGISAGTEGWVLRGLFKRVPIRFPCAPGYQRSGNVTAVGTNVTDWKVGDRVLALAGSWSGTDVQSVLGAHTAVANVSTVHAYHLAQAVHDIDASFGVVAQVGYNAAHRAGCEAEDWVLVYGDGLIGQFAAQAARARGARVILVGHRKNRLDLALRYSADQVLDSGTHDVAKSVRKITGAETIRVILDTVQTVAAQKQYLGLLEPRCGQIVYSGFTPGANWADMGLLQERELTTHFINGWTRERMVATLKLMASRKILVHPLITHLVPYASAPEMYRMILDGKEPFLGIALDWRDADAR